MAIAVLALASCSRGGGGSGGGSGGGGGGGGGGGTTIPEIIPSTPRPAYNSIPNFDIITPAQRENHPSPPGARTFANISAEYAAFAQTPCPLSAGNPGAPDAGSGDPLRGYQWYLDADYLNVDAAWAISNGTGVVVAINDAPVQTNHEDLIASMNSAHPFLNVYLSDNHTDRANLKVHPVSQTHDSCEPLAHGTAVAGIIGATRGNDVGVTGIAPHATLTGTNLINGLGLSEMSSKILIDAFTHNLTDVAVSSNSWGENNDTRLHPYPPVFPQLLEYGAINGFNAAGTSYVFASGNFGVILDPSRNIDTLSMSTYNTHMNLPYVIPVCGVSNANKRIAFSGAGGNLWVCGYTGHGAAEPDAITTTPNPILVRPINSGGIHFGTALDDAISEYVQEARPGRDEIASFGIATADLSDDQGFNNASRFLPNEPGFIYLDASCQTVAFSTNGADFGSGRIDIKNPLNRGSCPNKMVTLSSWPTGATDSYVRWLGGTSAAAPMVSGVIALIRSLNPILTWRDVKLILAQTAEEPDLSVAPVENYERRNCGAGHGARWRQGQGHYCHDHHYGFGIVDAYEAVKLAPNWRPIGTYPFVSQYAPATGPTTEARFTVLPSGATSINFIEYVHVEVRTPHPNFGELDIRIIGPSGQTSVLSLEHQCLTEGPIPNQNRIGTIPTDNCPDLANGYTFGSSAFLGGKMEGDWHLAVTRNGVALNPAAAWRLKFYGHRHPGR